MSTKQKVIQSNQSLAPFLGERLSFIRGLDPLGLQNASDAAFSMLLPGLNNVTGRIRYYSFYCWLLDEYSKRDGSTDPKRQQRFIRRAEYIIALASHYFSGDRGSIPGSLYAGREIQRGNTTHDLQAGTFKADGTTAKTYWNFPFGAFGQYYLGSLRDIGIITNREDKTKLYARTNTLREGHISGEMLAAAFDKNIDADNKELFFDCIKTGEIKEEDLTRLLPDLDLTTVPESSEERRLLLGLLTQKDYPIRKEEMPVTFRRETIKWLLEFVGDSSNKADDRAFTYHAFAWKGQGNEAPDDSLTGWYFYQFNEFWQFGNTSIFNGTLAHLEQTKGPNWEPLHRFVKSVTEGIVGEFKAGGWLDDADNTLGDLLGRLTADEHAFFNASLETQGIAKAANAFLLLFSLYLNNGEEIIRLKEYAENHDLVRDGEGTTYFVTQLVHKKGMSVEEFLVEYLYQRIIYRHQYVAYRKIGGGGLSTQKFILEDLHIRYLGNFDASYTGPRISRLLGFLRDLGIISPNGELGEDGIALLTRLNTPDND